MKITKLKNGYSIRVSDSEFKVVQLLEGEARGSGCWLEHESYPWSPSCRRVITEVQNRKRDWMMVTENRRK